MANITSMKDHESIDNYSNKLAKDFAQLNDSLKNLSELSSDVLSTEHDEDFLEVVDWSGIPVKLESSNKSQSFVTKISSVFYPVREVQTTDFETVSTSKSYNSPDKATTSLTIEDMVNRNKTDHSIEIKYSKLKQELEHHKRSKRRPADFTETINNLIQGYDCSLDMYRTKADKYALLEEALRSFDGNVISTIVVFLRSTLSDDTFYKLLKNNNVVADHYLQYLRQVKKYDEIIKTLIAIDRKLEAAFVEFSIISNKRNISVKIQCLKKLLENYFDSNSVADCQLLIDYANLLERLQALPKDTQSDVNGKYFDQVSVLDLLYYCSFHHYDLPPMSYTSPTSVRECHQLTERQFLWTVLRALCSQKRWTEIENLLQTKTVFGSTRITTSIELDKLTYLLASNKAPYNVLMFYMKQISDPLKLEYLSKNCEQFSNLDIKTFLDNSNKEKSNLVTSYVSKWIPNKFS